jgi:hypothetical protein
LDFWLWSRNAGRDITMCRSPEAPATQWETMAIIAGRMRLWRADGAELRRPEVQHKVDPLALVLATAPAR